MKLLVPMLLLALMAVSCGKKNSSGGKGSDNLANWDTLEDDTNSSTSYDVEQKISNAYLKALKQVFKQKRAQLRKKVGTYAYEQIQSKLQYLQITAESRVMEEYVTRKVVSSFYDGYTMTIYTGTAEKAHSWRFLLKNRNDKTTAKLYNDLLQLRNSSSYYDQYNSSSSSYSRSYYRNYNSRGNGRGGLNGSYYFNFRL